MRIIGGEWRGRKIPVAEVPGLRPTGDRVRETLFNWLAPWLPGTRCLDLFAGAGALGFEAASRGAAEVVLVEADRRAAELLAEWAEKLDPERLTVVHDDALAWLRGNPGQHFDIVFIDPPFDSDLGERVMPGVAELVAPGGWLYLEGPAVEAVSAMPAGFETAREGRYGQARVRLLRRPAS